jgi:hypothetical protein
MCCMIFDLTKCITKIQSKLKILFKMKRQIFLYLISCTFISAIDFEEKPEFPKKKVIQTFRKILGYEQDEIRGSIISINEKIIKINDSNLKELLPNTTFYFLTIVNHSHYEYNYGKIQTVAAISNVDSNDIRLLLPLSYAKNSKDFNDLFLNKSIKNKEKTCLSITNLYFKTYTFLSIINDKKVKKISHSATQVGNVVTVTTSWIEDHLEFNSEKKSLKKKTRLTQKSLKFTFEGDNLIGMNYEDWRK